MMKQGQETKFRKTKDQMNDNQEDSFTFLRANHIQVHMPTAETMHEISPWHSCNMN